MPPGTPQHQAEGNKLSFAEMTKRNQTKPTTRSVVNNIDTRSNTTLTLFRSHNERTLVFDFSGQDRQLKAMVSVIANKYGDKVCGIVPHTQAPRIEVTFRPKVDLAAVEKEGFSIDSSSIPIHRTYSKKANLLLVTLLNTPVSSEEELSTFLQQELAQYGSVHDIRLCYWPDTPKYMMPRAIALFDLDKEPGTPNNLPTFIHCPNSGAEISLRWKGAPPACRYCKKEGHTIGECKRRTRWSKKAKVASEPEAPSSPSPSASPETTSPSMENFPVTTDAEMPIPTPAKTNHTNPSKDDSMAEDTIEAPNQTPPSHQPATAQTVTGDVPMTSNGSGAASTKRDATGTRKKRTGIVPAGIAKPTGPYLRTRLAKSGAIKKMSADKGPDTPRAMRNDRTTADSEERQTKTSIDVSMPSQESPPPPNNQPLIKASWASQMEEVTQE